MFVTGQRVRVTLGDFTAAGTIHRPCISSSAIWVRLDVDPPESHRKFDPPDPRNKDILAYADEIEALS